MVGIWSAGSAQDKVIIVEPNIDERNVFIDLVDLNVMGDGGSNMN